MSCSFQVWSIFTLIIYWLEITNGTPLFQGFSVQKGFEVNLKPFHFKPISFFREKWSPFGRFGVRKGIQKRDLESATGISDEKEPPPLLVPPAPVFEHINEDKTIEERKESMETSPIGIRTDLGPEKSIVSNMIRIPLTENFKLPTERLYTSIGRNPSANNYIIEKPPQPVVEEIYGELPPRPVGPVPEPIAGSSTAQLASSVVSQQAGFIPPQRVNPIPVQQAGFIPAQQVNPVPAQQAGFVPAQPVNPIPTQPIGFRPAQTFDVTPVQPAISKEVVPLITPPPGPPVNAIQNVPFSEIPPTDGPLVRGSKLALYFGNVFLQLVSQFLTNARLQFSQFSRQSVPPPVPISN